MQLRVRNSNHCSQEKVLLLQMVADCWLLLASGRQLITNIIAHTTAATATAASLAAPNKESG